MGTIRGDRVGDATEMLVVGLLRRPRMSAKKRMCFVAESHLSHPRQCVGEQLRFAFGKEASDAGFVDTYFPELLASADLRVEAVNLRRFPNL